QISPFGHWPQSTTSPQPSPIEPHSASTSSQLSGSQPGPPGPPHLFGSVAPQTWPSGHGPHWMMSPQPSPMAPHSAPCASQVVGVQLGVQLPQFSTPPQPSGITPQRSPHSIGVQVGGVGSSPTHAPRSNSM